MGRGKEAPLRERKRLEQQREAAILHALTSRDKALEADKRDKKQKKRSIGQLLAMLNQKAIQGASIRPASTYVPKSHNVDKQVMGLISHLYVQYPVPPFMYQACIKGDTPFANRQEMFRHWFICLAQGMSFRKLAQGYMTGREAFIFLSAPAKYRIHEAVWWAKMRAADLPIGVIDRLIERVFTHRFIEDEDGRLAEVILFYARYHAEMNRVTFGEVTDFLSWKLNNDRQFRVKGRTVGSVVKLTNEWQRLMQKAKLGVRVEWKGMGLPEWSFEEKDRVWFIDELRNNRDLLNEGQKQKHCVYSYVDWCSKGYSAIFSMRGYRKIVSECLEDGQLTWDRSFEMNRITIEVNAQRSIVQVRGYQNRLATQDEKRVLRLWSGEKGLTIKGQ